MQKMPKSLQSWLIPKLRRISTYWPGKNIAKANAKIRIPDGNFKNGKPRFKARWKCVMCEDLFMDAEIRMDHITPVINVKGFAGWEETLSNIFCNPEGYQCLCESCHFIKTQAENEERKENKKK